MKTLKINARNSEVADTAERLQILFERESDISEDEILKPLFVEIKSYANQLSEVIKSDRMTSELEAADVHRGTIIRRIDKILQGYSASPIENMQQSAVKLKSVFDRYGLKMIRENYAVESAHIESMLKDFADPSLATDVTSLIGFTEILALLKEAQKAFNEHRVTYEQAVALEQSKMKATELKKRLLQSINGGLLPYLTSLKTLKSKKHASFIDGVTQVIAGTNSAITARGKKVTNIPITPKKEGE